MSEQRNGLLAYLGVTFGIAWLAAGLFWALGGRWNTVPSFFVGVAMMLAPTAGALVARRFVERRPLAELGLSFRFNRWWLVAWLAPAAFALATFGVGLLMPGVEYAPDFAGLYARYGQLLGPEAIEQMKAQTAAMPISPFWLVLLQGQFSALTLGAVVGFGEEFGWRGYLLHRLRGLGFWRTSLLIGLIWGAWHAPAILQGHNYPQHPVLGAFLMVLWCLLLAGPFSFIAIKARSVIPAAIMHGALNSTWLLSTMLLKGGNDLTIGITGLPGFIVLAAVNLALLFARPKLEG